MNFSKIILSRLTKLNEFQNDYDIDDYDFAKLKNFKSKSNFGKFAIAILGDKVEKSFSKVLKLDKDLETMWDTKDRIFEDFEDNGYTLWTQKVLGKDKPLEHNDIKDFERYEIHRDKIIEVAEYPIIQIVEISYKFLKKKNKDVSGPAFLLDFDIVNTKEIKTESYVTEKNVLEEIKKIVSYDKDPLTYKEVSSFSNGGGASGKEEAKLGKLKVEHSWVRSDYDEERYELFNGNESITSCYDEGKSVDRVKVWQFFLLQIAKAIVAGKIILEDLK